MMATSVLVHVSQSRSMCSEQRCFLTLALSLFFCFSWWGERISQAFSWGGGLILFAEGFDGPIIVGGWRLGDQEFINDNGNLWLWRWIFASARVW